jgi:cell division protease FtsH
MERHQKFTLWYFSVGIWVVLLFQYLLYSPFAVRKIPYSEFLRLLDGKRIADVAISANTIQGKMLISEDGSKAADFETKIVDRDISGMLQKNHIRFKEEIDSNPIPRLLSWIIPGSLFIGIWVFFSRLRLSDPPTFFISGKVKTQIYSESVLDVSFADVGGLDEAKQAITEVIDFLCAPKNYTALGCSLPKGVLLIGPSGAGKTLLAKAAAGQSGVCFFRFSSAEFVEMFVDFGGAGIRELFLKARQHAPCIIFIDDLDRLLPARGPASTNAHQLSRQALDLLLANMQRLMAEDGVVLMAATERPDALDSSLLLPERFGRQIFVGMPTKKDRAEILKIHLSRIEMHKRLHLEKLADRTIGMTGADIAHWVNQSLLLALQKQKRELSNADLMTTLEPGASGWDKRKRLISPRERKIIAYHEIGHAIVALSFPGADPIKEISIIPRDMNSFGYITRTFTEDLFLMNRTKLLNRIAILLGGRAAENLIFGDFTTRARQDLSKATEIAMRMITEYGMGEHLGQVYFDLKKSIPVSKGRSDDPEHLIPARARRIDLEVYETISSQYSAALDILKDRKAILDKGARMILEHEKIDGKQIEALMHPATAA